MPRKQKQYHYIYKTINLLSGKYYIGMHSTNNLNAEYYGSGKRLRYSINKYGKENHKVEILEYLKSREELKKREEEIVNLNEIAKEDCMNLVIGGYGGYTPGVNGFKKGNTHWKKGVKNLIKHLNEDPVFYEEYKKRYIKNTNWKKNYSWKGKKHSEETKEKMSMAASIRTGTKNSQYGTCWITNEKESKKIMKDDLIPKGWRLGRKIK